MFNL
jgi:hypothetical protein